MICLFVCFFMLKLLQYCNYIIIVMQIKLMLLLLFISDNLVSKISDHLHQFLIVDNLKVNYKVLNYYKNDFSKFDEEKFINDFSLLDWNSFSSDYMGANTKFDILYDQISQFINSHVPRRKLSKREIKLSTKPWIEISSIPKSLGVNIQIQIWYIFIRNSRIVLSKMSKRANLIISRITFCVIRITWKKSGLELDQLSTLVKLKLIKFAVF